MLVATHLNTDCCHNHFVVNSVSFVDGKKLVVKKGTYLELRRVSDTLCRERGLSVIEHPQGKTPRSLYQAEKRGEDFSLERMQVRIRQNSYTVQLEQPRYQKITTLPQKMRCRGSLCPK